MYFLLEQTLFWCFDACASGHPGRISGALLGLRFACASGVSMYVLVSFGIVSFLFGAGFGGDFGVLWMLWFRSRVRFGCLLGYVLLQTYYYYHYYYCCCYYYYHYYYHYYY